MPSSACDWSSDVCSSDRSEEHTSELQSRSDLVCRLLLEKKKTSPSHHSGQTPAPNHPCPRSPCQPQPARTKQLAKDTTTRRPPTQMPTSHNRASRTQSVP